MSLIAIKKSDGTITAQYAYCNEDTRIMLYKYYNTPDRIKKLCEFGPLWSIGKYIDPEFANCCEIDEIGISSYSYKGEEGKCLEFQSEEEFIKFVYSLRTNNSLLETKAFLFDSSTGIWMSYLLYARKSIPYESAVLNHKKATKVTLAEAKELRDFILKSLTPTEKMHYEDLKKSNFGHFIIDRKELTEEEQGYLEWLYKLSQIIQDAENKNEEYIYDPKNPSLHEIETVKAGQKDTRPYYIEEIHACLSDLSPEELKAVLEVLTKRVQDQQNCTKTTGEIPIGHLGSIESEPEIS